MRTLTLQRTIHLLAPAKLNLGLEVLSKRPDGYHTVKTILQAVSLFDHIYLIPTQSHGQISVVGELIQDDLVQRAVDVAREAFGVIATVDILLRKQIPAAAGLGGGSSDAGTVLTALGLLAGYPVSEIQTAAATIGSDVPFFVRGGTALATGTGTTLMQLPSPGRLWFVVALPDIQIPNKTAALYGELSMSDFTAGDLTADLAVQLGSMQAIEPASLHNTFSRPLLTREPIRALHEQMTVGSGQPVWPSGAGPALFTLHTTWAEARAFHLKLQANGLRSWLCTVTGPDLNAGRIERVRQTLP